MHLKKLHAKGLVSGEGSGTHKANPAADSNCRSFALHTATFTIVTSFVYVQGD